MKKRDYFADSLELHRKHGGKISIKSKVELNDKHDLSTVYSPGVSEPCRQIALSPLKLQTILMILI